MTISKDNSKYVVSGNMDELNLIRELIYGVRRTTKKRLKDDLKVNNDKVLQKVLTAIKIWSKSKCTYFEPDVCNQCDKLRKKIKRILNEK